MSDTSQTLPMLWPDEEPLARRSDPLSSHVAADRSQKTRAAVRDAVVTLIRVYGPQTGNDLNAAYDTVRVAHGWPRVHPDSPRKRAGDLTRDGVLTVTNPDCPRGTPHIYALKGGAS